MPEQVLCVLPQAAQAMHLQKDYHASLTCLRIYSVRRITKVLFIPSVGSSESLFRNSWHPLS